MGKRVCGFSELGLQAGRLINRIGDGARQLLSNEARGLLDFPGKRSGLVNRVGVEKNPEAALCIQIRIAKGCGKSLVFLR